MPELYSGQSGRARRSMRTVSRSPLTKGTSGKSRQASGRMGRGQGIRQVRSGTGSPAKSRCEGRSSIHAPWRA